MLQNAQMDLQTMFTLLFILQFLTLMEDGPSGLSGVHAMPPVV